MQTIKKRLTKVEIAKKICAKLYPTFSVGASDCWIHWVCMNYKREQLVRHYNYIFPEAII